MLTSKSRPFMVVLTKVDKLNEANAFLALEAAKKKLMLYPMAAPMIHLTSAKSLYGV